MKVLYTVAAVIFAPFWIWFIFKMKLRDIERRNKRDAPIELHLNR